MPLVTRVEDLKLRRVHETGRTTVSGRLIVEPDWFLREAAGEKQPEYPGLTMAEYRRRKQEQLKAVIIAAALLVLVLLAVGVWIL